MWLLTTEGAYSAIRWHDGQICVRARRKQDLDRLRKIVPALSKVKITLGTDYRYRAFCTPDEWADGMAAMAKTIDYGNFKNEVAKKRGYKDPYEKSLHTIWSVLARLQPGGPYGDTRDRAGYPAVPKGEKKLKVPKKLRQFATTIPPSQLRLPRPSSTFHEDEGLACEECGKILEPSEAEVDRGFAYCRDGIACMERVGMTR